MTADSQCSWGVGEGLRPLVKSRFTNLVGSNSVHRTRPSIKLLSFTLDDSLRDITAREFGIKIDEHKTISCFNGNFSIIKLGTADRNWQKPGRPCEAWPRYSNTDISWDKIFKNGRSKICGRMPLKNFTWSFLNTLSQLISLVWWMKFGRFPAIAISIDLFGNVLAGSI